PIAALSASSATSVLAAHNDRTVRSIGHPRPPENDQLTMGQSIFGARGEEPERRTRFQSVTAVENQATRRGGRQLITQTTTGRDRFLGRAGGEGPGGTPRAVDASQELQCRSIPRVGLVPVGEVTGGGQDDQLRPANLPVNDLHRRQRGIAIAADE